MITLFEKTTIPKLYFRSIKWKLTNSYSPENKYESNILLIKIEGEKLKRVTRDNLPDIRRVDGKTKKNANANAKKSNIRTGFHL